MLADDPMLLPRGVEKRRPLIRAVMDSRLRTPMDSKLVKTAGEGKVIVYCSADEIKGTVPFNEIKGMSPLLSGAWRWCGWRRGGWEGFHRS